ncbi:MAG: hypothetical protein AAF563_00995 [Pseudomonadota bacterium]
MASRLLIATLLVIALSHPISADNDDTFVAGIGDLPLMEGLVEDPDAAIIYDKPEGRIVEAIAHGNVAAEDVRTFYGDTLLQLGWQASGEDMVFTREGEVLTIVVDDEGNTATVSFSLAPR